MATEQMIRSRDIPVSPGTVWSVLSDPARHQETEPGDWVRAAIDTDLIVRAGQVFRMNMFAEAAGPYVMHNEVLDFQPGEVIAWRPGQPDESGELGFGGWSWRYDLEPSPGSGSDSNGTRVTLTYDWSRTPLEVREEIGGMPPFGPEFLDESLASLEAAVLADA